MLEKFIQFYEIINEYNVKKTLVHLQCLILPSLFTIWFVLNFLFASIIGWFIWCWCFYKLFKLTISIITYFTWNRLDQLNLFNNSEFLFIIGQFVCLFLFVSIYSIHWYNDRKAEERGSHPKLFLRNSFTWKYLKSYFPISLILSELVDSDNDLYDKNQFDQLKSDLTNDSITANTNTIDEHTVNDINNDNNINKNCQLKNQYLNIKELFPNKFNYLVGYHPHGILGLGAFVNFGTEANDFSEKFPGLTPWLTTLELNFKSPLQREIMLSFNIVSATYNGLIYLLDPKKCGNTGNFVVVVLGGAHEALDSRPGKYIFHTNRRYGFFKLALMTGSHLVPCVSFGEPGMYKQVHNPRGSYLRRFQERFTDWATFSLPLFYAKALLPYKNPVNTVVGRPIPLEKIEQPTREQISALKERYLTELKNLFYKYRPLYDPEANDLEFF